MSLSITEVIGLGQELIVQSEAIGEAGITKVELVINGEVIRIDANPDPQPQTPYIVRQSWRPTILGSYTIQTRAYQTNDAVGQSEVFIVNVAEITSPLATPTVQVFNMRATDGADQANAVASDAASPGDGTPRLEPTPVPLIPVDESNQGEDEADEEPTPISLVSATETPSPSPTPSPTPSVTPTLPTFKPTGLEPTERFGEIWTELGQGQSRLGYPTDGVILGRNYAWQTFERGFMVWWDSPVHPDLIWAIDWPNRDSLGGPHWTQHDDTWSGQDDFSCDAAENRGGPRRGFGWIWCETAGVQDRLGQQTRLETGSAGNEPFADVQFFQGGLMIYNPLASQVYVLFYQGDWQVFWY